MKDTINVTDVNTFHTCVHCAASHTVSLQCRVSPDYAELGELFGAQEEENAFHTSPFPPWGRSNLIIISL